jgi:hypothetical protein
MIDNVSDPVTKPGANVGKALCPALVFNCIVQQGGNCLVFIGTCFDRQRRDARQIRNVRDARSLAALLAVDAACIGEGLVKSFGQHFDGPLDMAQAPPRCFGWFAGLTCWGGPWLHSPVRAPLSTQVQMRQPSSFAPKQVARRRSQDMIWPGS